MGPPSGHYPKRLVFSGGGIRVTAFIGALEVLEKRGYLTKIKEYVGVSAGGFLAFMLAIGYTIKEIRELIIGLDFNIIRNIEPDIDRFGLDDGANFEKLLISLLRIKGLRGDYSFKHMPFENLRIYATDLNTCKAREFSKILTPDVKLIDAIRASAALPIYFMPVKDPMTGNLLTDGGAINNYPMIHLKGEEIEESLGFTFNFIKTRTSEIKTIMEFTTQLLNTVISNRHINGYEHRTVVINKGDYPAWHFEASLDDKEMLMEEGRKAMREYIDNCFFIKSSTILRRNSY